MNNIILPQNGISFTHLWGRDCNLKCSFCLNEGKNNLIANKNKNFKIAEIISNLSFMNFVNEPSIIYVEHGGELLYCDYVFELLEYKINNIKNYKSWFFTNGTNFNKLKELYNNFHNNIEFFLSYHFNSMSKFNDFFQSVNFLFEKTNQCNIAIVYHENLDFNSFKKHMDYLKNKNAYIKVWFDFRIFLKDNFTKLKILSQSKKFMEYLDEHFKYKHMIEDENDNYFSDIPNNYIKNNYIERDRVSIENIDNHTLLITDKRELLTNLDNLELKLFDYINNRTFKKANSLR